MNFEKMRLLFEEKKEGTDGGQPPAGGGDPKPAAADSAKPPPGAPPPQTKGDDGKKPVDPPETDEFGYEKKKEDKKPDAAPPEDPKLEGEVGGYGKKALKVEEEKKEDPPPEKKEELGFEVKVDGLEKPVADRALALIKSAKFTKEQADAYIADQLAITAEGKKNFGEAEKAAARQRAEWDKSLREDPTFGGANFEKNLARVGKLLNEFGPETQKVLTERKTMLPDYFMRMFMRMADALYDTGRLVQGDRSTPPEEKKEEENDPLEYYR